jgi:hypothetical protein
MRLRDLDGHFVGEWAERSYRVLLTVEGAQGLLFQCPLCSVGKTRGPRAGRAVDARDEGRTWAEGAHYVLCWFTNPRNAARVPDDAFPIPGRWNFTGESIDDITFVGPQAASVHLSGPGCGWHGFVKDGGTE